MTTFRAALQGWGRERSGRGGRWRLPAWWRSWLSPLLLVGFTLGFLLAPLLAAGDPDQIDLGRRLLAPSGDALLGTDHLGRDTLLRVLHGGQRALGVGLIAVACSMTLALLVGATAGFLGGRADLLLSAVLDLLLALPGLLVTLALLGILGVSGWTLIVALVGATWAGEARILRGAVYATRESGYVEATHCLGATRARILARHVLPNIATPLLMLASLNLGEVLLTVSALSFLGLGAQPPHADWGTMLADSRPVVAVAPWLMLAPGLCIVAFSVLANLTGDALRAVLDPHAYR